MKGITALITACLLSVGLHAFEVQEMPSVQNRVMPEVNQETIYSYHNAIAKPKKGVVNISTQKKVQTGQNLRQHPLMNDPFFQQFFGNMFGNMVPRERVERALGSGVVISNEGYIVTNNHVIDGADVIVVTMPGHKKDYEAKLVGRDPKSDLAVIKIDAEDLQPVPFGNSDELQEGDVVFAIGDPFGVGETVTQGIVSALNKSGIGLNDYENFIQTDASINPGNSGGALIDSRGALVGINTAILSKTGGNHGVGFAIPSNMVKQIAKLLIENGEVERGYLGVSIQDITEDLRDIYNRDDGAVIVSIAEESPAAKAGLQRGDLIVTVDGKKVRDSANLKNIIGSFAPESKISVEYIRDKQRRNTTVMLDKLGGDMSFTGGQASVFDGAKVGRLTDELRQHYDIPKRVDGVLITEVAQNSKAEEFGFRQGDVIMQIESVLISEVDDLREALNRYDNRRKRVFINRRGIDRIVVVP